MKNEELHNELLIKGDIKIQFKRGKYETSTFNTRLCV